MNLNIDSKTNTGNIGILVGKVKIIQAIDVSNVPLPFRTTPFALAIKLILDIGRTFTPELIIGGDFTRHADGTITGWGSAWRVRAFFENLGYTGSLTEDGKMLPEMLEFVQGKEFYRLSYITGVKPDGRAKYSDWHEIGNINQPVTAFVERFKRAVAKGYPTNYRPELANSNTPEDDIVDDDLCSFP